MEAVSIYESKQYINDDDFEDEEVKDEYYSSEFWNDCDYLTNPKNSNQYDFVIVDGEVIIRDDDIPDNVEKAILQFAEKDYKNYFEELVVGNHHALEDNDEYNAEKPYIKYRGGSGYWFAHHQYKKIMISES